MKTCLDCRFAKDYPQQANKVCTRNPPVGFVIPATTYEAAKIGSVYPPIPLVTCGEFRDRDTTATVVPLQRRLLTAEEQFALEEAVIKAADAESLPPG